MSITTEEAEQLATVYDWTAEDEQTSTGLRAGAKMTAAALRSLAAERDALKANQDKAQGYLSRCLQALYPNIEPLADLLGVCTQIDNVLAGQQAEIEKLRAALRQIADQSCDTFQINPEGGQSIAVEGHYRFAFEEDVKALLAIARAALGEKQ